MRSVFLWGLIAVGMIVAVAGFFPSADSPGRRDTWMQLIYLFAILIFIGGGALRLYKGKSFKALQDIVTWVGIILLLVLFYSFRHDFSAIKTRLTGELFPAQPVVNASGAVTVRMGRNGHFFLNARVNGHSVRFMVDTGASRVVLSPRDAAEIGIDPATLNYNQRTYTANGMVWGAPIRIKSMKVGDYLEEDVPASVNSADMEESLLGMSYLERLKSYKVEQGILTLEW